MDKVIFALAEKYQKGRKHVHIGDIVAVIERESGGDPIFHGSEILFAANLNAASHITGMGKDEILRAVRIDHGEYAGRISKFRCEPGYWEWSKHLDGFEQDEKFVLSCSFGVGQKMARWLVANVPDRKKWIPIVRHFMGSLADQVMYVAGDMNDLLALSHDDRPLAYTRYNAGPGAKHASEYGTDVFARYKKFYKL